MHEVGWLSQNSCLYHKVYWDTLFAASGQLCQQQNIIWTILTVYSYYHKRSFIVILLYVIDQIASVMASEHQFNTLLIKSRELTHKNYPDFLFPGTQIFFLHSACLGSQINSYIIDVFSKPFSSMLRSTIFTEPTQNILIVAIRFYLLKATLDIINQQNNDQKR